MVVGRPVARSVDQRKTASTKSNQRLFLAELPLIGGGQRQIVHLSAAFGHRDGREAFLPPSKATKVVRRIRRLDRWMR